MSSPVSSSSARSIDIIDAWTISDDLETGENDSILEGSPFPQKDNISINQKPLTESHPRSMSSKQSSFESSSNSMHRIEADVEDGSKIEMNPKKHHRKGSSRGEANDMQDEELVSMLQQKPKYIQQLRSRDSFRRFFYGMEEERIKRLLNLAFHELDDNSRHDKVERRLSLLNGVLKSEKSLELL